MVMHRKNAALWCAYQWWYEICELEKRHKLRINAVERGVSNMNAEFEQTRLDALLLRTRDKKRGGGTVTYSFLDESRDLMIAEGRGILCWEWATSIKGLKAGGQVAKVLAMIDDISKFSSVSKLWRYAGYGLYQYWINDKGKLIVPKDGYVWNDTTKERDYVMVNPEQMLGKGYQLLWRADRGIAGWLLPFSKPLKSAIYIVVDSFIKQRTPVYRDYYDKQKAEYRIKYPEKIKVNGKTKYNDGHINTMAIRKTAKLWLQHLWVVWRTEEGLPVTKPWVFIHAGHIDYIEPPNYDVSKIVYEDN